MKKAVTGHGHATKAQIRHMVMRLLELPREPNNDASDALGLAICHAHAGSLMSQMAKATSLSRRTHAQIKGGRVY
jgi:crossover junction endodeoxyribonuclease RuvC